MPRDLCVTPSGMANGRNEIDPRRRAQMSTKRFQSGPSKPAALRARPKHPVVDADGHTAEFEPGVLDYLKDIAGSKAVERNKAASDGAFFFPWNRMTDQESA